MSPEYPNTAPAPAPAPGGDDRVQLNVGGTLFEASVATLSSGGSDSLLSALASSALSRGGGPIFIDRDPDIFSALLSLLRSNRLPSSALRRFSLRHLSDEALFYGLHPLLRSAVSPPPLFALSASPTASPLLPPFHPFPSSLSATDSASASDDAADEDDCLLIGHGGHISAYDWALSPSATVPTHLLEITSLRRIWPGTAAAGSAFSPGLHFYDLSGARLVSSLNWTDPSDPRIYKACVTAISDSPASVFASFVCPHKENCVLVVDKGTLQVAAEIGRQPGTSAKSAVPTKLACLPEHNLLFGSAISCGAFGFSGYVRLWDLRSSATVWETNEPGSGRSSRFGDPFADSDVDPDESAIFKVCSKSGDLAVADLRKLGEDPWVYLEEKNPSLRNSGGSSCVLLHCYQKQVFVSRDGALEVWSQVVGEKREGTSACERIYRRNLIDKEEHANRGVIKMMQGGGNRLFICREGVEGIEVWESSNSSGAIPVDR